MKVLFIFNSNKFIGKGHESRCISIATNLIMLGCDVYLATSLESKISKNNLNIFKNTIFYNDKKTLIKYLIENSYKFKSIVIDTYDISSNEIICIKDNCSIYKFDLAPNLNEKRIKYISFDPIYNGKSDFHCLGPKYFPFKKDFIQIKERQIINNNDNKSVFVFFGGGNNSELIKKYHAYFKFLYTNQFKINVVATRFYENLSDISGSMNFINFIMEPENIAKEIALNSFCFISGGTIIYECIFLDQVPQVISTANNQINQSLSFHNTGKANYIGKSNKVSSQDLITDFKKNMSLYINNKGKFPSQDFNMGQNLLAREICDGFK